jgi:hypothetical protein
MAFIVGRSCIFIFFSKMLISRGGAGVKPIILSLSSRPPQAGKPATANPARRTGIYAVVDVANTSKHKDPFSQGRTG